MFELLGYSEEELFFVRAADELDVDGEAFGRAAHGQGKTGKASEIKPLAEAHGIAIVVGLAGNVIALTVLERRFGGDSGKKNRDIAELAKNGGAGEIAGGAGFLEGVESDRWLGLNRPEVGDEHRAQERFIALCRLADEPADHGPEEKPPQFEGLLQIFELLRFDTIVEITQKLRGAAQGGKSFRCCAAEFWIFENADAQAAQGGVSDGAERYGRGECVAGIGAEHEREETAEV